MPLCINNYYHTFHIHTSLSNFFYKISGYVIDIKACLYSLLFFAGGVNKYFLKITLTFLFSWVPVYRDKDQQLAVKAIGFLFNNRLS